MAGWENIMKDEDPYLPTLSEEERARLAKRVEELAQH